MKRVLTILVLPSVLLATETRLNTLAQGFADILLDDNTYIQFAPSRMFLFGKHYSLEAPNVPGYAYVSLFYTRGSLGFGGYFGRTHTLTFQFTEEPDISLQPMDIVLAYTTGNLSFGGNLIFGTSSISQSDGNNLTTSANVFGFVPSLTYTISENSGVDVYLRFLSSSASTSLNNTVLEKVSNMDILVGGRYYSPLFVLFLNAGFPSQYNEQDANNNVRISTTSIRLGSALPFRFDNGFAYASLILNYTSSTQSVRFGGVLQESKLSGYNLTALVGGEFKVWRELFMRGSMSFLILSSATQSVPGATQTGTLIGTRGILTLGGGYNFGWFVLDFALSTDLLYNGPFFLTGLQSNFITQLSIYGSFGE